jgi:methionine-rich copper-binding protein CopC
MRPSRCAFVVAAWLLAMAGPAWGHGREVKTDPKRNAELRRPPAAVTLELTEAATDDAIVRVADGCNENIAAHIAVSEETITAHLVRGQPGEYHVNWRVISAVDGHPTKGAFTFSVKGKPDCSSGNGGGGGNNGGDAEDTGGGGGAAAPPASDEDDSSFPVVPVGLGVLGVIAIGLGARFAGSR